MASSVRNSVALGILLSIVLLAFTIVRWTKTPNLIVEGSQSSSAQLLFDEVFSEFSDEPLTTKRWKVLLQKDVHRAARRVSLRRTGAFILRNKPTTRPLVTTVPLTTVPPTTVSTTTVPPTTDPPTTITTSGKPTARPTSKAAVMLDGYGPAPAVFHPNHFELYTRLNYDRRWGEARSMLLPSLQLFWPHAHLVISLDEESDQHAARIVPRKVAEEFPPLRARSALVADYPELQGVPEYGGWQRGQLDMMFADTIAKATYVGLLDTDTFFSTLVAPHAVFKDNSRPIIFATVGRIESPWFNAIINVKFMLKKDYVIGCMNHFPVVFKTAHIREMRAYVEKVHGKPFVQVYKEMVHKRKFNCHYSTMCNYVWHFHRDEYYFRFWNYYQDRDGWDKPQLGQTRDFSFLTSQNKMPLASVSTHLAHTNIVDDFDPPYGERVATTYHHLVNHIEGLYRRRFFDHLLVQGFCYVALAQCRTPTECSTMKSACARVGVDADKYQYLLFRFEIQQTWEWDSRTKEAQKIYYDSLKSYTNWIDYGKATLSKFCPGEYSKLGLR